ncbi:MAG: DPP IV N-terminal domain-containing protein, partial [Phycisphaerales bacterium]|nr:DPP IV N-terminal domain-containing protein [Phycisphaerales bacterium]
MRSSLPVVLLLLVVALGASADRLVLNERVETTWLGADALAIRLETADGWRYEHVHAPTGERRPLFDHARLAADLAGPLGRDVDATHLPILRIESRDGHATLLVEGAAHVWAVDPDTGVAAAGPRLEDAGFGLRPIRRERPSRQTGPTTEIRFVNRTAAPVHVFWIDASGESKSYGTIEAGGTRAQHTFAGHVWRITNEDERTIAVFVAEPAVGVAVIDGGTSGDDADAPPRSRRDAQTSPDGRYRVRFAHDNVVLVATDGGEERALTTDGGTDDAYVGPVHWSPDSAHVVVMQRRAGDRRRVAYIESSPRDQLQPKLHEYDYLKPGDRIPQARPRLFATPSLADARAVAVDDALFPNPWSIDRVHWQPDGRAFSFLFNARGHQAMRLLSVDASNGAVRAIIDEPITTFFDYSQKTFLRHLDDTGEVLWMSERDGWNHLFVVDAARNEVMRCVTPGPWVVRAVVSVDDAARTVLVRAMGLHPDQDPYHEHLARVDLDTGAIVALTDGDGTHEVEFSPDGDYLVARWSRVDHPPVTELRRATDGGLVATLAEADWSGLRETGWRPPRRFVAKGRDGVTDIWGVVHAPHDLGADERLPVVEQIYAGPHGAHVPKSFRRHFGAQAVADLGFFVVQIDGMGTNWRSKAFHDVCWRNLGDAGFPDRIAWIKAAADADPRLDLGAGVGIYGGSAGGQNAMRALIAHHDFYTVAAADCGCHDNRMDKIWWNEAWMGWPIGPHYAEQSNVTNAHRLTGKLLLVVGALDRNVDP